ncbi:MAG: 4-hydroxy-tetrahydrodipicolinate reductase [Candidatus Omnitrophota bacterium]
MIKLAITGYCGRMGQRIYALAKTDKNFSVVALLDRADHPDIGKVVDGITITSDLLAIKKADVLIDFTLPEPTEKNIKICLKKKIRMVIGTTGLSDAQYRQIKKASSNLAIVQSTNMSVGVNVFFKLTKLLAEKTGSNYNIRIVEAHHIHKKDAPSGTAKTLAQIIETAKKITVNDIQSIREGEIVGDHDVIFESDVDTLTLRHHAKNRDIFVEGALLAAKFINKKKSGLYNMHDVLGLK